MRLASRARWKRCVPRFALSNVWNSKGFYLHSLQLICLFPLTFISSPLSSHLLPSFPGIAWPPDVLAHLYPSGAGQQPLHSPCPPSSLALALLQRDHIRSRWKALLPNLCHILWPVIAPAPEPPALDHK